MTAYPRKTRDGTAAAAWAAAAVLALLGFAAPAGATVYQLEPGLTVNDNDPVPPIADGEAEAANDPLFPGGVDIIGKWEFDSGDFEAGDNPLFTDNAVEVTVDGDTYIWSLLENIDNWNIVKIGVKQRETTGYFLVDPFVGADSGEFTMAQLFALGPANLAGWLGPQGQLTADLSHITFFGSPGGTLPEPGTLGIMGLGLLLGGILLRRRPASA